MRFSNENRSPSFTVLDTLRDVRPVHPENAVGEMIDCPVKRMSSDVMPVLSAKA